MKKILIFVLCMFCLISFVSAKDLYVSPIGNDSVSYEDNDINNPWRTPERLWGYLNTTYKTVYFDLDQDVILTNTDIPQAGDTVYFRNGIYNITRKLGSKYVGNEGNLTHPIRFTSYNNENVILQSSLSTVVNIDYDNIHIYNMTFNGEHRFFHIGATFTAYNFKFSNCIGYLNLEGGSVNEAVVTLQSNNSNGAIIENSKFYGPIGSTNTNTAGIFIWRTENITIRNNEFSDFPSAVFYKHAGSGKYTGSSITDNYFKDSINGIVNVGQYINISNNLFVNSSMLFNLGGGLGDDGQNNGGDYNNITYNTFYNGKLSLLGIDDGDGSGAQYNTIRNNVFTQMIAIHPYKTKPHYSMMDYNLYPLIGDSVYSNSSTFTLTNWQVYYGQDMNSILGIPIFVNISSNMDTIEDFEIIGGLANNAASDGTDMGANISCVGIGKNCNIEISINDKSYDTNNNHLIDTIELIAIIQAWKKDELSMMEMFDVLDKWKKKNMI